jgi:hypothetical protein
MVVDTSHLGASTEDHSCVTDEQSGIGRSGVPPRLDTLNAGAIRLLGDFPSFISLLTVHDGRKRKLVNVFLQTSKTYGRLELVK